MLVCCGNNGFGHLGHVTFLIGRDKKDDSIIHMDEIVTNVRCAAHFLTFDSAHGMSHQETIGSDNTLMVGMIGYMANECCTGHQGSAPTRGWSPSVPMLILHPSQLTRGSEQ